MGWIYVTQSINNTEKNQHKNFKNKYSFLNERFLLFKLYPRVVLFIFPWQNQPESDNLQQFFLLKKYFYEVLGEKNLSTKQKQKN